jgi:cellulose synthase/poly-beta-1,6-N-acetylglucosamine synthase-like glycosyltransferase
MVSVVIPSYESSLYVRSALNALQAQETSVTYEIVFIDSSTDGTERIIEEEFPFVRLIHFPVRCTVGRARNIGVDAAQGEVILFVDTDTIPCPTWLDQMYRAIKEGGADGVCGGMSNGTPWSITGSAGFYLEFFRFLAYRGSLRPVQLLVGGNSGFRREILAESRYADNSESEDMLFSSRLSRTGKRLFFLPAASVRHLNRKGCRTILLYQRKLGRGAFVYRSEHSPREMRLLKALPELVFFMPCVVMLWIGFSILRHFRLADFLRFVLILPLCFIANFAWSAGLYGALRQAAQDPSPE